MEKVAELIYECVSPFYEVANVSINQQFKKDCTKQTEVTIWIEGDDVCSEILGSFRLPEGYSDNTLEMLAYACCDVDDVSDCL